MQDPTTQRIYRFARGSADGTADDRALLGGKGANLAQMSRLGIPVPPGFTITTEVCREFFEAGGKLPSGLDQEIRGALSWLAEQTGRKFGDRDNPLLVSVRSGARTSMPGMMDTILNLGLDDEAVKGLAARTRNERFAYDAYRRLLAMYGNVVGGAAHEAFDAPLDAARRAAAARLGIQMPDDTEALRQAVPDSQLGPEELRGVVTEFKRLSQDLPMEAEAQLAGAIAAVFRSWNTERAKLYRKMHDIPDDWGTAVNVQAMVFGNLSDRSGSGVAFTRDPSSGERRFFGEWLPNAQGEDVVAGIRTPLPISARDGDPGVSLEEAMPEAYRDLREVERKLEQHFRDMQDIEFTIEDGRLYLLQTRTGKRSARAEVRIAVEMVAEGAIDEKEAVVRVQPERFEELLFPRVSPDYDGEPVARGLAASPGAVTGRVTFSADEATKLADEGHRVVLVRVETSPEDLHGMKAARGFLTARGGATSHAALVARAMGRPCVVGCSELSVDYSSDRARFSRSDAELCPGDLLTLDGSTGAVYLGDVPKVPPDLTGDVDQLLGWAKRLGRMNVRANADTPQQVEQARALGAEGVGLCRTEHMFFGGERIAAMREMILASSTDARERALAKLLPYQTDDFVGIFKAMAGFPVTIRLLDPPLHEFLPTDEAQIGELAGLTGIDATVLKARSAELHEANPMLGHRGCRLAITFPEIYDMQARAILDAACTVQAAGIEVKPEIMIPLAATRVELERTRAIVDRAAASVFRKTGRNIRYKFGTMIELPRAAIRADELAEVAEFFSFGTNDLTQTTLGLSRDDAGRFLPAYVDTDVLRRDPFVSIDRAGVGELVRLAVDRGRQTRPDLSLGICGEHGGDPESIDFFEELGLDYVSCSPHRAPVARLGRRPAPR